MRPRERLHRVRRVERRVVKHAYMEVHSALPGMAWPAITTPEVATALAVQFELQRTQWLAADAVRDAQVRQLDAVLRHAWRTVPWYQWHWHGRYAPDAALSLEGFEGLPLLTRGHLQREFEALKSSAPPAEHGAVTEGRTAGSTGNPVRTLRTGVVGSWWQALTLREHLWHRRDFGGTLAAIRAGVEDYEGEGWGPATAMIAAPGRSLALNIGESLDAQFEWLCRREPDYLLTHPSIAAELARISLSRGIRLPRLREVRTFGELAPADMRQWCREAWGVPVTDVYSADEAGYIALQCPDHEHYHVQSETVLVEVLDGGDRPCPPGAVGRVVITTLQNFAMPLVRYELGDFAEVGEPCPCGRGLPVLRRIVGRTRNILVTASGERYWPSISARSVAEVAPIRQYQLVQKSLERLEARLVTAAPLTAGQEARLREHILARLPAGFALEFNYLPHIPRSSGGKFEDFVSEVA